MGTVESVICPMLPMLKSCHNTIISYRDYQKLGDEEIRRFCKQALGRDIRIIVKEDDHYEEEVLMNRYRSNRKKSKTVILELL